jgi:hypothetical protein
LTALRSLPLPTHQPPRLTLPAVDAARRAASSRLAFSSIVSAVLRMIA